MLHKETVTPVTLELIIRLQKEKLFANFLLAEGTGLALKIGHRTSVDIDLFSRNSFDANRFLEYLEKHFGFQMQFMHQNTLKGIANGVLVDIITHDYPNVQPGIVAKGIHLFSKPDIAAMKLNAISGDGTRVKDFIDIYFLLKEYSLREILSFYSAKYGKRNEFHALKSLTYFHDVDLSGWPKMLKEVNLSFDEVKKSLCYHRDKFIT